MVYVATEICLIIEKQRHKNLKTPAKFTCNSRVKMYFKNTSSNMEMDCTIGLYSRNLSDSREIMSQKPQDSAKIDLTEKGFQTNIK